MVAEPPAHLDVSVIDAVEQVAPLSYLYALCVCAWEWSVRGSARESVLALYLSCSRRVREGNSLQQGT